MNCLIAKTKATQEKEKLIVVLCPTLTSPYYVLLLQGIESVANEKGYGVFYLQHTERCGAGRKISAYDQHDGPQGIIYACNPHPDFQKKVEELARRIPLLLSVIKKRQRQ